MGDKRRGSGNTLSVEGVDPQSSVLDLRKMGLLGHTVLLSLWHWNRSETLRKSPGMLLDGFSNQTVDSESVLSHFESVSSRRG